MIEDSIHFTGARTSTFVDPTTGLGVYVELQDNPRHSYLSQYSDRNGIYIGLAWQVQDKKAIHVPHIVSNWVFAY